MVMHYQELVSLAIPPAKPVEMVLILIASPVQQAHFYSLLIKQIHQEIAWLVAQINISLTHLKINAETAQLLLLLEINHAQLV